MPVATPRQFATMLDTAQKDAYAYPAVNCSSLVTVNAALKGFADSKSDGIIQFSTGAGQFSSGLNLKDMVLGVQVLDRDRGVIGVGGAQPDRERRPTPDRAAAFAAIRAAPG